MEFLQHLLPSQSNLNLESWNLDSINHQMTLNVSSTQAVATCPLCNNATHRIHSRYERTLKDLRCVNYGLTILLQVAKFFCLNDGCKRRIFTERLPQVTLPWARRTCRLAENLRAIALALGGAAGSRLTHAQNNGISRNTVLLLISSIPLPPITTPKILGVDDFSFRKGHLYGTILVDLESHRPIALLADRKAETLANWLKEHPGVEVLSRDRSKAYKSGMTEGAPDAIQVADRFHLFQNLSETLEDMFNSHINTLNTVEREQNQEAAMNIANTVAVPAVPLTSSIKVLPQGKQSHQQRVARHQQIWKLHQQDLPLTEIAQQVGMSIKSVQRYLQNPQTPEPKRRNTFGLSRLNPYKDYLLQLWNDGITRPQVLLKLLQQKGYSGGARTLTRYLSRIRQAQGLGSKRSVSTEGLPNVIDPQYPPLTPRRATYLTLQKAENRDPEDAHLLQQLVTEHPQIAEAVELTEGFALLLRQRQAAQFDPWLLKALKSQLKPFQRFAEGLFEDYEAVKASMTLETSNGPVEGLVNRLKMLKRQMYGRAGLDLLSKRFLLPS